MNVRNKKLGASKPMLFLVIFIGLVLVVSGVGLQLIKMGKLDVSSLFAKEDETPKVTQIISTNVDTVPIPSGFYYVGGSKATGLVISDNELDKEKGDLHETSKTLVGNQYVWIPVEDMQNFKRNLSNNFLQEEKYSIKIMEENVLKAGANIWEVIISQGVVVDAETEATLKEASAMYRSVEKYKGFYIARYEAGLSVARQYVTDELTGTTSLPSINSKQIVFKEGSYPCNFVSWSESYNIEQEQGGVVELARNIYPDGNSEYAVVSTLTYGVQIDAILNIQDNMKGNYSDSNFAYFGRYMTDEKTLEYIVDKISTEKLTDETNLFTTGSTNYSRAYNIYDLAGNLKEWTMEGVTVITDESVSYGRIVKGGSYQQLSSEVNVKTRESRRQDYSSIDLGFRVALYIKEAVQ